MTQVVQVVVGVVKKINRVISQPRFYKIGVVVL